MSSHAANLCPILISFIPVPQVFPQRQQSSRTAALQHVEREEFARGCEEGKLDSGKVQRCVVDRWAQYSKADSPNLLFLCVKLKPSTCFHCFVQEAGGGAQLKWVGVCYYSSGLHSHFPFPSCHTQDFSEHRNSHTGIQADRFQCLLSIMGGVTCGNLKTDEEEVKTVRVRGGQGGDHAECMKHFPINAVIIYEHVWWPCEQ